MGGRNKAALSAPGTREPLLQRLLRLGREAGIACVVVGCDQSCGDTVVIADEPSGIGPLGGLCALLDHAGNRPVLALACDLPYVDGALLARLLETQSRAHVLCPRDRETGKWQPLFARYDSRRVLPVVRAAIARGERSFQGVFREIDVDELRLSVAEHALLRDWDHPSDIHD